MPESNTATRTREAVVKPMAEAALQRHVEAAAKQLGWLCFHTWMSARSEPGFPDLICLRRGRMIVAELKRDGKRPTVPQERWLDEFRYLAESANVRRDIVQVFVWTPADWESGLIARVLGGVDYLYDLEEAT
ncbi:MAG: hypothetical protein M3440_04555 [Chloroflexota bacterium]|nr:hypothetical protein [Chloroflexota bacterium]